MARCCKFHDVNMFDDFTEKDVFKYVCVMLHTESLCLAYEIDNHLIYVRVHVACIRLTE